MTNDTTDTTETADNDDATSTTDGGEYTSPEIPLVKIVGRSGIELDVDKSTAASLVAQGVATYADGEPPPESDADDASDEDTVDGGDAEDEGDEDAVDEVGGTGMPAESDTKAMWVTYAVDVHGARFSEANRLTKAELIAQYGQAAQSDEDVEDES